MPAVRHLTLDEILTIHQRLLDALGGEPGVLSQTALESAVEVVRAAFAGEELHAGVYAKAAAYLWHLARSHPFVDGNKRTAVTAMCHFLRLNGHDLTACNDSLVRIAERTATGDASEEEVARWVRQNTTIRI